MKKEDLDTLLKKAGLPPGFQNNGNQKVILPGQTDQMEQVSNFINTFTQQLDSVLGNLELGISKIGQGLDLTRLQMYMMYKILIDKKICTEEEMKEYYKKEVSAKMKEMQEEMLKKMQQQQASAAKSDIKSRG